MNRLDVSAQQELLPQNPIPIPEPFNKDEDICPPTERYAPSNAKFGYGDLLFDMQSFSDTTKNLPMR